MSGNKNGLPEAISFFHTDGFVPCYKFLQAYMGEEGRMATLPDIIESRIASPLGSASWERYFTTMTAEYVGRSVGGLRIIIVAHCIGPMASFDGVLEAYKHEYGDKERRTKGGRIGLNEFRKLENGFYGPVEIVEIDPFLKRHEYGFHSYLTYSQLIDEPLAWARLGAHTREYLELHAVHARTWSEQQGLGQVKDPVLVQIGGGGGRYQYEDPGKDQVFAHLLSFGQLMDLHSPHENGLSRHLSCDVQLHDWSDGTRLAASRVAGPFHQIVEGPSPYEILQLHWKDLAKPTHKPTNSHGFAALVKLGEDWFSQHSKRGESLDTCEPEFSVVEITPIGELTTFRTEIVGHYIFFRYGIKDVKRIAPPEANAYEIVGEPWIDGDQHAANVQFYRVKLDTTRRLPTTKQIWSDAELMARYIVKI